MENLQYPRYIAIEMSIRLSLIKVSELQIIIGSLRYFSAVSLSLKGQSARFYIAVTARF